MNPKRAVALIYGGVGCEREVSARGAEYLCTLIDKSEFDLIPILITESGELTVSDPQRSTASPNVAHLIRMYGRGGIVSGGDFTPISVAFPLLHGDYGEDGTIQGTLRSLGIPFVGCDVITGAVCIDKIYTKILAESLGIRTAPFLTAEPGIKDNGELCRLARLAESKLGYPLFIKPSRLGSSVGASRVESEDDFAAAYRNAARGGGRVLIEACLDIKFEAECAYLSTKKHEIITAPSGISYESGFYDYEKKYSSSGGARLIDRLPISAELTSAIHAEAAALARFIGLRHLSRIDFFVTTSDELYFNEINTMPGFTDGSLYPKMLKLHGIDPAVAINEMIRDALSG